MYIDLFYYPSSRNCISILSHDKVTLHTLLPPLSESLGWFLSLLTISKKRKKIQTTRVPVTAYKLIEKWIVHLKHYYLDKEHEFKSLRFTSFLTSGSYCGIIFRKLFFTVKISFHSGVTFLNFAKCLLYITHTHNCSWQGFISVSMIFNVRHVEGSSTIKLSPDSFCTSCLIKPKFSANLLSFHVFIHKFFTDRQKSGLLF